MANPRVIFRRIRGRLVAFQDKHGDKAFPVGAAIGAVGGTLLGAKHADRILKGLPGKSSPHLDALIKGEFAGFGAVGGAFAAGGVASLLFNKKLREQNAPYLKRGAAISAASVVGGYAALPILRKIAQQSSIQNKLIHVQKSQAVALGVLGAAQVGLFAADWINFGKAIRAAPSGKKTETAAQVSAVSLLSKPFASRVSKSSLRAIYNFGRARVVRDVAASRLVRIGR